MKLSRAASREPAGVHVFGPAPYPDTAAPCGLCGALSATDTLAVRSPGAAGANRTDTVHVAPGMSGAPAQPVEPRKSPGWCPETLTPLTFIGAVPSLATV